MLYQKQSLQINSDTVYVLHFSEGHLDTPLQIKGRELYEVIKYSMKSDKIKDIHSSLAKAVEQGSEINLGIVIGQVLCMLNELKDGN